MAEKLPHEKTLEEVVADEVKGNKFSYASHILDAFRKGDNSAMKMVLKSLEDSKYQENKDFPLNDDQYKQIIQLASRRLSGEFNTLKGA